MRIRLDTREPPINTKQTLGRHKSQGNQNHDVFFSCSFTCLHRRVFKMDLLATLINCDIRTCLRYYHRATDMCASIPMPIDDGLWSDQQQSRIELEKSYRTKKKQKPINQTVLAQVTRIRLTKERRKNPSNIRLMGKKREPKHCQPELLSYYVCGKAVNSRKLYSIYVCIGAE